VDIAVLASLYSIRVVAGAFAASVAASGWLIAFIYPLFLGLGCVKRMTELAHATTEDRLPGRGYARRDRGDLLNIGWTSAVAASVVFVLYTYGGTAAALYDRHLLLLLTAVPVFIWQARMIILGWRGQMDHDPIVFALRDRWGLTLVAVILAMLIMASS
jgi:hypothetical protein